MSMRPRTLSLAAVALVLAASTACTSSEQTTAGAGSARTSSVATSTTADRDIGAEIDAKNNAIAQLLAKGCGEDPKPSCEESGQQVMAYAREMQDLMVETGRTEFYSQGKAIIARLLSAPSSELLRSAALDLVRWVEVHPG